MSPTPIADPYETKPSFWMRHTEFFGAAAVFALTVLLTVAAFPPHQGPEFGYAFAAPAIFWSYLKPRLRLFAWTMGAAQAVAWTTLLFWLHHVTWLGLALLGPFVGAWVGVWYLAVWWTMPRMLGRPTLVRLAAQCGLAGLWVVIEWSRTWLLGGFAWLPLAASQWQRNSVLQIASYTGAAGVSFVLIAMNVGFSAYGHRLLREEGRRGFARRSQEFMLALFLLIACLCVFMVEVRPFDRPQNLRLGRVAFVQPDIPQGDQMGSREGSGKLSRAGAIDARCGPNPSRPGTLARIGDESAGDDQRRCAQCRDRAGGRIHAPILFGSDAYENLGMANERAFNAAFVVAPDFGLQPAFYAKRKLVPFGEYVPLRPILGWLSKVVPIGPDDYAAGTEASPLVVGLPTGSAAFGVLICFEDTYPALARRTVLEGADVLSVLTNDAWFGEEGEASQHAAHSVQRAVDTRRLVLRCGNAGWSGWIDEFGGTRFNDKDETGSVYFRGSQTEDITRDARWIGRNSFYVEHGDWFVLVSALLAIVGYFAVATGKVEADGKTSQSSD